jgi:hypothetical protein
MIATSGLYMDSIQTFGKIPAQAPHRTSPDYKSDPQGDNPDQLKSASDSSSRSHRTGQQHITSQALAASSSAD